MRVQPLQVGQRPDPLVPDEDDEEEGGLPEGDGQEAHHAIGHDAFIHTGDVGGSLLVLARTTRDVGAKQELFVCYGPRESIGFFDTHPCLCHQCGSLP